MAYKTLTLLCIMCLQTSFAIENEPENKSEKMRKQLKGEIRSKEKPSLCAPADEECIKKELAEAKKLMQQKLKGSAKEEGPSAQKIE